MESRVFEKESPETRKRGRLKFKMTFREVKRGDYIINVKVLEATPWYVNAKWNGMVLIRRKPKVGKLTALMPGQLRAFQLIHQAKYD